MGERLQRQGALVLKRLRADSTLTPQRLAQLSVQLRHAGVATPRCHYDERHHLLCYPWQEGRSAREWFATELQASAHDWPGPALLMRLLAPVVALHRVPPRWELPPLDPWRRIAPRLGLLDERQQRAVVYPLQQRWQRIGQDCGVILHGDFHLGQLLLREHDQAAQLLDLEDCCQGPREFDLGNFAAHLVSSAPEHRFSAAELQRQLDALSAAYQQLGGEPLERQRLRLCAQLALLRRALKLAEQGQPPVRWQPLLEWLAQQP